MFCRTCKYDLRQLTEDRCPECGRPFDPADESTYRKSADWRGGWWFVQRSCRRMWIPSGLLACVALLLVLSSSGFLDTSWWHDGTRFIDVYGKARPRVIENAWESQLVGGSAGAFDVPRAIEEGWLSPALTIDEICAGHRLAVKVRIAAIGAISFGIMAILGVVGYYRHRGMHFTLSVAILALSVIAYPAMRMRRTSIILSQIPSYAYVQDDYVYADSYDQTLSDEERARTILLSEARPWPSGMIRFVTMDGKLHSVALRTRSSYPLQREHEAFLEKHSERP